MKTFKELEEIGIISVFADDGQLKAITKDGGYWEYDHYVEKFRLFTTL